MKNVIRTLVLAVAEVVSFSPVSAQAGGYGHGHYHHQYAPVYRQVIVQKVYIPVTPIYTAPIYNSYCH